MPEIWRISKAFGSKFFSLSKCTDCISEVYRIRISGLQSGRIQHIFNKPDWDRSTVIFKFPDQDQDFQISSFLVFDANTIIKIWAKI